VPRLDDADPHVRECAIRVAGYFGFDECLAAILDAADDPHEDVRRAAIEQLPLLQHPRAIPRFLAALANDTPRNRAAAAHAAGFVDDAASDEALVHALDDADAWVRYFAAGSVARRRSIAAVPALVEHALRDSATHVRIAALRALGALEAPHLADVAAALVRDPDADLAAAALAALASAADPRVDDLLVEAGQSSNPACRAPAVHALASRPGRQSAEVLGWAARVDEPRGLRAIAIEALRRQADGAGDRRPAAETLLALAVERDVREHALTALASLPASAVDTIAAGLTAERLPVRLAAVEALARMRHRRASEALAVALHDAAPAVRSAAVAAFGRLGTPSIGPVIAELEATDPDDAVRRRASGVCARHGWRRAFHQR
jgi:HEAT repeat protein